MMGRGREQAEGNFAALDPGREKCGFAIVDRSGDPLFQAIFETSGLVELLKEARERIPFDFLLLGNGTTSEDAGKKIAERIPDLSVRVVDEYKTTELARLLYFEMHPPRGMRRLLPITMQSPPVPVDDYAAILLARRYLEKRESKWTE